ncbi:pentatricopeptide repeat-containing protein At3g04130, mitochondrial isoform X2 [Diospyros lotus]|nr:pentatricopeptide repeat-containing protein At3g04130, mitochondrial isoform X2 [Diospyros lotus]XP_052206251.1 pentatricopeptide repeat-containing protein At3g04130, mitochondrial isoform X2 [Diospyros lotus]XP_052206252.1 pentatricopeptide repeat-containing protein At3g04130, mitochondrial isoform X2 [Diospyros lotus]
MQVHKAPHTQYIPLFIFPFMCYQVWNHIKRSIFLGDLFASRTFSHAVFGYFSCSLSSSSFPCPLDSSSLSGSQVGCQEAKSFDLTKNFDFHALMTKVRAATSANEIFQLLTHDHACNIVLSSPSIVDILLHQFKDDWKSALGVFRWAASHPGYKLSPKAYDLMVDILGKAKQMEKMKELVEEMCQAHLVTLATIAKVMRRLAGAGEWEDAVRTFDDLGTFGLDKNTESMNLLLDTLCKEKNVEQARAIFLELKLHIPPNAHTFNIFIHGWCKINRVDEAHWTIQEMKGHGCRPCVISYSIIILSYCRQSNFQKVYELLDDMKTQGCQPNVVTYTTILCSLTKSYKFEEALQIPEKMKSSGCKPDTYFCNALINTLGRANRLCEAVNVFEVTMPKLGVTRNTSTYNTMIAMFCHHDEQQKALNVLKEMENSPSCKPDAQSFYPLLKTCFRSGKTDSQLRELLDDMVIKHHISFDVSTYTLLIHGLCRENKCEWAYLLFEEMMSQDLKPRYRTCRLLLDEIKQKNMYDAAEKIETFIKQMKSY